MTNEIEQAKLTLAEVEAMLSYSWWQAWPPEEAGRLLHALARALHASQTALRKAEWGTWGLLRKCPVCASGEGLGHRGGCELEAALLDKGGGDGTGT